MSMSDRWRATKSASETRSVHNSRRCRLTTTKTAVRGGMLRPHCFHQAFGGTMATRSDTPLPCSPRSSPVGMPGHDACRESVVVGSGEAVAHFRKSLQRELAGMGLELNFSHGLTCKFQGWKVPRGRALAGFGRWARRSDQRISAPSTSRTKERQGRPAPWRHQRLQLHVRGIACGAACCHVFERCLCRADRPANVAAGTVARLRFGHTWRSRRARWRNLAGVAPAASPSYFAAGGLGLRVSGRHAPAAYMASIW